MFETPSPPAPRIERLGRRATVAFLAVFLGLGLASAYRAYFQVWSLELRVGAPALHAGTSIETAVVTSGTTFVDVQVEIVQGAETVKLAKQFVPTNRNPSLDPRPRRASQRVVLAEADLAELRLGPALVRATAVGRPQWLRTPPPTVRQRWVTIGAEPAARAATPRTPSRASRSRRTSRRSVRAHSLLEGSNHGHATTGRQRSVWFSRYRTFTRVVL